MRAIKPLATKQLADLTRSIHDAERALESGALGVGSMGPKVRASALFVRHGGPRAIIAELGDGLRALEGKTGTSIVGETL